MKRQMIHSILAALGAGAILGCGDRDHPVRIGALAPLTGEASGFGHSTRQGYELAVEEWNARGGVLGRRIKLVLGNDKGEPVEGAMACTRLIEQERVSAILGPALSSVALAAAPIAQAQRIPLITPTASNPRVTQAGDYIFRACFTDTFQGALGAAFAYDDLSVRRAACLYDGSSDYSRGLAGSFKAAFAGRGGRIVAEEVRSPEAREYQERLARILAAGPDLVYLPEYAPQAAQAAKELRKLGFTGPLLGGDGWESDRLVRLGGEALENSFYTSHCFRDNPSPAVQDYVKKHLARYSSLPDAHAMLAYDAVWVLMDAIGRAGTTDGQAVQAALRGTDLLAVSGPIRFNSLREPQKPGVVIEIRKGQQVCRPMARPL